MQPTPITHPETPRDAATVVLLRDTPGGMETLLLRLWYPVTVATISRANVSCRCS